MMHLEYLSALSALHRQLQRELDAAQLGQPPRPEFANAVGTVMEQRRRLLYGEET